jgi:hypothetical protein
VIAQYLHFSARDAQAADRRAATSSITGAVVQSRSDLDLYAAGIDLTLVDLRAAHARLRSSEPAMNDR